MSRMRFVGSTTSHPAMKYEVIILKRAQQELHDAADRIAKDAPETAERWFNGFIEALRTLEVNPERCSPAPEDSSFTYEVRQFFYRTASKYPTRALFTIVGREVRILRIDVQVKT